MQRIQDGWLPLCCKLRLLGTHKAFPCSFSWEHRPRCSHVKMVKDNLQIKINEALKARDELRLSTLKMLSSEIHNAEIDNKGVLSKEQELVVVNKEAKKRKDAIEAYEKAGAMDRAERERQELAILQEYLPKQLGDAELTLMVDQAIMEINPQGLGDMSKVIGVVKAKVGAQADGGRIASLVKDKLG